MSDMTDRFAVIPDVAPDGWETTVPRYRVARAVRPSGNSRFRHEPPFSQIMEGDAVTGCWQYATRDYAVGEIIETRDFWPHPTFQPLNYAAKMVLQFFNSAPKSRLPRSPSYDGKIRLSTGLDGAQPSFATITRPRPEDRLRTVSPLAPRPTAA